MMILKGERLVNLYKMTESVIVDDTSAMEEVTIRLWHIHLGHMSKQDL